MAYELTGTVKLVQEAQTFGSGFTKREFVVMVEDGKYPQEICLECVQDKVSLLDPLKEGDKVHVTFDIRGREYNGRYFTNLQAWRVRADDSAEGGGGGGDNAPAPSGDGPPLPSEAPDEEIDDDFPF